MGSLCYRHDFADRVLRVFPDIYVVVINREVLARHDESILTAVSLLVALALTPSKFT